MKGIEFSPLPDYRKLQPEEMVKRALSFHNEMKKRRSVRSFTTKPPPSKVIKHCIQTAGTAPSGANLQPWHFVIIGDPDIKKIIRQSAEKEERAFYHHRASAQWLQALKPLGTDENKPFLEDAPYLICIFVQAYGLKTAGRKVKHYYAVESVGIATGILITAIHLSGLVCLTHTPSPMNFLNRILKRPDNERPFLILAVGYPAENAQVPKIKKKSLEEIATFMGTAQLNQET